jgi:hypothetical protein
LIWNISSIVKYYDSLVSDQTRMRGNIGESLQKSILQVVLKYLERIHLEHKGSSLPEDWTLEPLRTAPQQNNAFYCGAFVCMFIDFIHDGCDFDFPMNEINVRDWQKNMILSIMSNKSSIDNNDDSEDEVFCTGGKMEMKFTQKSKKIVSESKWKKESTTITKDCSSNMGAMVECDENCNGGRECTNKRIQKNQWNMMEQRETQNRGDGLFAMEDIEKGNFIIEYMGKIVYKEQNSEYGMKINGMDLWIESKRKKD